MVTSDNALTGAIDAGDSGRLKAMLLADSSNLWRRIDFKPLGHYGLTLLHVAILFKRPEILEMLLSFGLEANARDSSGATALYFAAKQREPEFVKRLLSAGAMVNEGLGASTPLHGVCAQLDRSGLEQPVQSCIDVLLEHGVDANHKNEEGETAAFNLVRSPKITEYVEPLKCLLSKVDPTSKNKHGQSLMHALAIEANWSWDGLFQKLPIEAIGLLFQSGVRPSRDSFGKAPFEYLTHPEGTKTANKVERLFATGTY